MNREEFIKMICGKRECTESTGKTHWYTMVRVYKLADKAYKSKLPKTSGWITEGLIAKLKKAIDSTTKLRNILSTIVVYLRCTKAPKSKITKFVEEMYKAAKFVREQPPGKRTKRQEGLWIGGEQLKTFHEDTWAEATKLLKKRTLTKKETEIVRNALLIGIHGGLMSPPRNDWATATLVHSKEDTHGLDTIVYNKHGWKVGIFGKTRKSHGGMKVIKLPTKFSKLLKKYISKVGIESDNRLFLSNSGKAFTNKTYGEHIKKIFNRRFGKKVGTSMLRVLYVSHKYKKLPKLLADLEEDARKMMHSSKTSTQHYLKNATK